MKYVDVHILLHSLKSGSLVAFWLFFAEDFLSNTICDKALIAWEVALILLWEPLLFFFAWLQIEIWNNERGTLAVFST